MRARLASILSAFAIGAIAAGAALIFADRFTTQLGIGSALIVVGVGVWLIVREG